jgi:valyl-tRNA synthetase
VKVTPAHDPNDFAMGQRHDLPMITVMNKDGTMNAEAGPFEGLDRFEARKAVVATPGGRRLPGAHRGLSPHGALQRSRQGARGAAALHPVVRQNRPLADKALDALDNHQSPRFVPERWTKVYRDWLVSLRDWCISRQLWWGHQIPAWYAVSETDGEITDTPPLWWPWMRRKPRPGDRPIWRRRGA